jgi:molecular chaperone GrpE
VTHGDDEKDLPAEPTGLEPVPPSAADEAEALRREVAELKDQVLRRRAEFENYKKRTERDRAQAQVEAKAAVLSGLVPAIDNLERALEVDAGQTALREGVELIRRELTALLEAHDVTIEDPQGQPFDPERHQALSHEHVPGFDEGTVVAVFRKGYALRDRLLRPALVKVGKAADEGSGAASGEKVH